MALRNLFNELNRDIYVGPGKKNGMVSGQFYRTDSLQNGNPVRVDPSTLRYGSGPNNGTVMNGGGYTGARMNGGNSYSNVRMNGMGSFSIGPTGDGFGGAPGGHNSFVNNKLNEMSGKSLSEKLAELERLRKNQQLGFALVIAGFTALLLLTLLAGATNSTLLSSLAIIFMISGVLAVVYIAKNGGFGGNTDFKALYKSVFVEDVLNRKFQNVFYSWKIGFPDMAVRSFNLVRMGNRFKSEDYICATYKDVKFETSDVLIQHHTSSGKSSHTTTYFKGRMFVIYMPKAIQASVRITPDGYPYIPGSDRKLDKLDLENVFFNKQFNVYASDPHYAFYLLTPNMMEKILYLKGKYGYIILNFEGDKVFVAIPYAKDTFDAELSKAIDYPTNKAKVEAEASVICDLMEVLDAVPRG